MENAKKTQNILINGMQISSENTGVQYYTKYLYISLNEIAQDEINFHLLDSSGLKLTSNNIPQDNSNTKIHPIKNYRFKRIFLENIILPKYLHKKKYLLYHSPHYVLPLFLKSPSVLTIHDLITLDFPQYCKNDSVLYFKLLLARSIKNATKIIAVSETVKNDIIRHYPIAKDKVRVIYHGINPIFRKTINKTVIDKYSIPEQYILFVGNIEPKKNIERLIKAFDILKRTTNFTHKLVITGKKEWKCKSVFETIADLKMESEIIFTGYVPEEDLPAIYSMSDLFVFPSLYEGFGIPPLEAMACEVPVITSNKGALPEITGGNCVLVDPYNIKEITNAMQHLLIDKYLRNKNIEDGKAWVKQFSWKRTAIETLKVYKDALQKH
jgi:glycosyltransferase involved in cell wall biosynthesis